MFGIGGFELFIILLFGFLVFGPDKLPEIARTLGAALRKFQDAQKEMEAVLKDEVLEADAPKAKKPAAAGVKTSAKPAPKATQESFAERKARYDKERAEREKKQAEQQQARAAMKEEAAQKAAAEKQASEVKEPAATSAAINPDELFGIKPKKPAKAAAAESVDATSEVKPAAAVQPTAVEPAPVSEGGE